MARGRAAGGQGPCAPGCSHSAVQGLRDPHPHPLFVGEDCWLLSPWMLGRPQRPQGGQSGMRLRTGGHGNRATAPRGGPARPGQSEGEGRQLGEFPSCVASPIRHPVGPRKRGLAFRRAELVTHLAHLLGPQNSKMAGCRLGPRVTQERPRPAGKGGHPEAPWTQGALLAQLGAWGWGDAQGLSGDSSRPAHSRSPPSPCRSASRCCAVGATFLAPSRPQAPSPCMGLRCPLCFLQGRRRPVAGVGGHSPSATKEYCWSHLAPNWALGS